MGEDDRRRLADDEADERDVNAAARDKLSEGRPGQAERDEAARERMRDQWSATTTRARIRGRPGCPAVRLDAGGVAGRSSSALSRQSNSTAS
jgi:hypothetical protein